MVFSCPVCKGPIALWVLRPRLDCHHCKTTLGSNIHAALRHATMVAATVEVLFLAGLWIALGSLLDALGAWLAATALPGFLAWWPAMKYFVVLSVLDRKHAAGHS